MSGTTLLLYLILSSLGVTLSQNQTCTQNDWATFLSGLSNAPSCGEHITTILQFYDSNVIIPSDALEGACNNQCGGAFANYLRSTCNDTITANLLEHYCTYSNGTSTLGSYCRSTALDVFNKTLLRGLFLCHPITPGVLCSPICKQLLITVKDQLGCCFQHLYNNSAILDNLLSNGILPVVQYYGLQRLREPTFNVWMVCNVPAPQQCVAKPFSSNIPEQSAVRPQPVCVLDYVFTLPHADVCGVSLGAAIQPTTTNQSVITTDLENVCNSDCGGNYAQHVKTTCKDSITAEVLKIICTPSGNTAAVGPYCRFAYGTLYDQTFIGGLFTSCSAQTCSPGCKAGLLKIVHDIGCCYQAIYNNTYFLNTSFNSGLITPIAFYGLNSLGNASSNPWMVCDVQPPQTCEGDPFPGSVPLPVCSLDNWVAFISQLSNGIECGPNVAMVFSPAPTTIDDTTLIQALDTVCSATCGGLLDQYLVTTCNDPLSSELLRAYCRPTYGGARVGPRCRFASPDILQHSILSDLQACLMNTATNTCSVACREALTQLKSELDCCYQSMYNNSILLNLFLNAGFITDTELEILQHLRNPAINVWSLCGIPQPQECIGDTFPNTLECPPGTYRSGFTCYYCPANSNSTEVNEVLCPCLSGFFRTPEEGASDACSAPPSGCSDIGLINRTDQEVTLRWSKPLVTGRDDFYYTIGYSTGGTIGTHSFTSNTDMLVDVITGLSPGTAYTFTVTVENGVSSQDGANEHLRRCTLTTTTAEGRPSPPVDVRGFCNIVGWKMPHTPNGQLLSYDVQVHSTSIDEGEIETIASDQTYIYLRKGSTYRYGGALVRVRARTSTGAGQWSDDVSLGCNETLIQEPCPPGVYFAHMNRTYGNNSELQLASVGEGEQALFCKTDKTDCCDTPPNRVGDFYYPNGVQVPINKHRHGFYRSRGDQEVYLNKRNGVTLPTGVFHCEIPDSSGMTQKIFITLN